MKNQKTKSIITRLVAVLIGLFVFLALAAPAIAFNPQPEPPGSAAVGVTAGQTAHVHVSRTPPDDGAPALCDFTVSFLDATGEALFAIAARVASGQTFSTELPLVGALLGDGERLVLRAMVHFDHPDQRVREDCAAATRSALEISDTEIGRANVVMGIVPCVQPSDPIRTSGGN